MTQRPDIRFLPLSAPLGATVLLPVSLELELGEIGERLDKQSSGTLRRAAAAADFTGKPKTSAEVLAPAGLEVKRVVLIGAGRPAQNETLDWLKIGGTAWSLASQRSAETVSLVADDPDMTPSAVARMAEGATLRAYNFRKYKSKKPGDEPGDAGHPKPPGALLVHCTDPTAAEEAFAARGAVAEGVYLARDLVNEPANTLGPVEFAERLAGLGVPGLEVEVLDVEQLRALKMGALLAVGQGSARESRVAVLQWNGAKGRGKAKQPVCFVGKGVVFDTGGISMKPAAGMEDMKGDMGGAACVSGLMLALARRKANVNAVGIVGLVENMPSGTATRPGDIVTSMSGQTVEILNTDAEGRLVLADALWYAQERFKPRLIVDLATLTGAIMVALGKENAGLFSNNDRLARELEEAGTATGERVWRMPLAPAYDKLIDSKNADMKNIGGRYGGAITAAQFLQRFIKDASTPWAHLDVAGTAMDSSRDEINQSWGSGWGVRLLDEMVSAHYE
ncbi:MAG: leucyl aminopeptidase [Hyphomicrobiaceae bacterium]